MGISCSVALATIAILSMLFQTVWSALLHSPEKDDLGPAGRVTFTVQHRIDPSTNIIGVFSSFDKASSGGADGILWREEGDVVVDDY